MPQKDFDRYVNLTIDSGIEPITITYEAIREVDGNNLKAVILNPTVNSVILGTLKKADYIPATDKTNTSVLLFEHLLQAAISLQQELKKNETGLDFIAVRCPAKRVNDEDFDIYGIIKRVLSKNPTAKRENLCVVFDKELLNGENQEASVKAALDARLFKLKALITGAGEADFLTGKLLSFPLDFAIIEPSVTNYSGSRDKPLLTSAFVGFLQSLGINGIFRGESKFKDALKNTDAYGFLANDSEDLTKEQLITQLKAEEL